MPIDPAIVSSGSALLGALAGGGASLAAAIYTQRHQLSLQRIAREITKRETVYAEFIMGASAVMVNAYVEERVSLGRDQQNLIGVLERLRLFAPDDVIEAAEAVMTAIIQTALQPPIDLERMTAEDFGVARRATPLEPFSRACREDLDEIHRRFA